MSKNLHCDVGDHDFSEMEEGRAKLAVTFYNRYDDGSPNTVTEQADACAEHADLFRPTRRNITPRGRRTLRELTTQFPDSPKAVEAPAVEALPGKMLVDAEEYAEYIKYMEAQNGIVSP
jgi:hypothetical protein